MFLDTDDVRHPESIKIIEDCTLIDASVLTEKRDFLYRTSFKPYSIVLTKRKCTKLQLN